MGSLVVQGDTIHCRQCSAGWTIDTHNYLHGMQNTPDCSVSDALAKINHRLLERGGTFAEYDGRNDQLRLECDGVTWIERARGRSRVLGCGKLQLHTDRLEFRGTQTDVIPIQELTTASVDLQRRLVFRTAERTLEARVERGSVVAWERVANILRRAAVNN